jgi:hypothetical protein
MKQLIPLFLFLLPCFALAQYPSNGNQKITLGEQTTADGLVFRGSATDTVRKPSIDTMTYMVLDTTTNIIWHYKKATNNAWLRLNLLPSDTASMLTNYYRSGRALGTPSTGTVLTNATGLPLTSGVTGTLPVANGGTNRTTMPAGYILHGDGTSIDTAVNLFWNRTNSRLGIGTANPESPLQINASLTIDQFRITRLEQNNQGLSINAGAGRTYFLNYDGTNNIFPSYIFYSQKGDVINTHMTIEQSGALTIPNLAGINDVGADANGKLQAATSDINLKNTIENSPFGLNQILLLNPVTFLYNDTDRKIDSDVKEVGFIAQDVFDIIPNAVSSTGTGDLQLDYRAITATLVKAIQEQNLLIKALEQRIINLENK